MTNTATAKVSRLNNFDLLRIILASIVIVSHSYSLYGLAGGDWIERITHDKASFGYLGVGGFFAISGCLVYQSSQRTSTYSSFIGKRFLRIYPGLFVNALVSALVLGAIVVGSWSYFFDSSPYTYIIRTIGLFNLQWCIDGVFISNPYGCFINGSLWTIAYEFLFYILFFIPYLSKWINRNMKSVALLVLLVLFLMRVKYPDIGYDIPYTKIHVRELIHFAIWFVGGIFLGSTMDYWQKFKSPIAVVSFILLCGCLAGLIPFLLIYALLPTFVISFGICKSPLVADIQKYGDPSYGVYIYGFIVQQTLVHYLGKNLSFWAFMGLSLLFSLIMGYLSWFLVEKKALRLKKKHGVQARAEPVLCA